MDILNVAARPPVSVVEALRADFPALRRRIDGRQIVYLDSAATSLKPQAVIDAVAAYFVDCTSNVHRGQHALSEETSNRYEEARYLVAQRVNCLANEVCFVRNTTDGLNLVAHGIKWSPSDTVVGFVDSHHSQLLPWRNRAKVLLTRCGPDGRVDLDHYATHLRTRPRVVAITDCSNVTGAYAPLKTLVAMAKEAGAITVVDAAQSMPHRAIDVNEIPLDFLAFSSHKMLGPSGVGCLFGRRDLLDAMAPLQWGGGMVDWVDAHEARVRRIPHRFEAGTPAIESTIGFARAIEYLQGIDPTALAAHEAVLTSTMVRMALERPYLELLGPKDAHGRAPIVTLAVRSGGDVATIGRSLSDAYGMMCRTGHLCAQPLIDASMTGEALRISAYLYNTLAEVESVYAALDEIVSCWRRAPVSA